MRMRLILRPYCIATLLLLLCARTYGQRATVVFYSHGSRLTSGFPGAKHDIYFGSIYDGAKGLFTFRDGFFVHNDRYLVFSFEPGEHTFEASYSGRPLPRESLKVKLEENHVYFVRAQAETAGVPGVFTVQHGRLDLVRCEDAQDDLSKAKPLKDKALWEETKANRATMLVDGVPPACH